MKQLIQDAKFAPKLSLVILAIICLTTYLSCKKEIRNTGRIESGPSSLSTVSDADALPEIVDFITAGLNDTLTFETSEINTSLSYCVAIANLLYVPQDDDDIICNGVDTFTIEVTPVTINGTDFMISDSIRGFLHSLESGITEIANNHGFAGNSNLNFKLIQFQWPNDFSTVCSVSIIAYWGTVTSSSGCAFTGDFAARNIFRNPNSGDGGCYDAGGQEYADRQIRGALNDGSCNAELGCKDVIDITPQTGDYTNGPYDVLHTKFAFSNVTISPPGNWDLWYSLNPGANPLECLNENEIEDLFNYAKDYSDIHRPTYSIPGIATTIDKSIDYYAYDTWYADPPTPISIPEGSYYHFCSISYYVCMDVPIYPIAVKSFSDWRSGL